MDRAHGPGSAQAPLAPGRAWAPFFPQMPSKDAGRQPWGRRPGRVGSLRGFGPPRATHWLHRRRLWGWPRLSGEEGDSRPSPRHRQSGEAVQAPGHPRTQLAGCLLPLWPGSPSPGAWGASASPCCGPGLRASLTLRGFTGPMPPSSSHPLLGHSHKSCRPLVRREQVVVGWSTRTFRPAGPSLKKGCAAGTRETSPGGWEKGSWAGAVRCLQPPSHHTWELLLCLRAGLRDERRWQRSGWPRTSPPSGPGEPQSDPLQRVGLASPGQCLRHWMHQALEGMDPSEQRGLEPGTYSQRRPVPRG